MGVAQIVEDICHARDSNLELLEALERQLKSVLYAVEPLVRRYCETCSEPTYFYRPDLLRHGPRHRVGLSSDFGEPLYLFFACFQYVSPCASPWAVVHKRPKPLHPLHALKGYGLRAHRAFAMIAP